MKKVAEDPLSSSGVSSLSGISAYNIRKISIYKNGDRYHRGVKVSLLSVDGIETLYISVRNKSTSCERYGTIAQSNK